MKLTTTTGITGRIFAGLGVMIFLLIIVLVSAYLDVQKSQRSQQVLVEHNMGNLYDLPALRSNLNVQRLTIAIMLELPPKDWGRWILEIRQRRRRADSVISNLIFRFRDVPKESGMLGTLIAAENEYRRIQDKQIKSLLEGDSAQTAKALFLGVQMRNYEKLRSIMQSLEKNELREARASLVTTKNMTNALGREFLLVGLLSIFTAGIIAAFINRRVNSYLRKVNSAEAALSRANRALRMLNKCNTITIRASDETRLLEDICRTMVESGGYKLAWVGYADDDKNKSVRPMAFSGEGADYVEHARVSWGDNDRGNGPTGTSIRSGKIVVTRDTSTDPAFEPWRYKAREMGLRSVATLPLKIGERVYGALMVYSANVDAFDDEEVNLLMQLASDLAYSTTALRDHLARELAERKFRDAAAYTRSLLESGLDPLIIISPSGRITDVNAATEEMLGKCRTELIGTEFSEYFTDPDRAREGCLQALNDRPVRDLVLTARDSSGNTVRVSCSASVFRDKDGNLGGVLAVARETARMQL